MLRHFVPLVLAAALGSGSTCNSETTGSQPADTTRSAGNPVSAGDETRCVDAWLEKNKMDQYGNPTGTMYMGGTPLFDEASGKTTDRLELIYKNHPEARTACHPK